MTTNAKRIKVESSSVPCWHDVAGCGQYCSTSYPGWTGPNAPPGEQLNLAGTGRQGIVNLRNLLQHADFNGTAICDVAELWDNSQIYYRRNGGRSPAMKAIKEHYLRKGWEI